KDYYQDSCCSHVKHQFKTGAFQINDELVVSIGFSSEKQLLTAYIKKHGKSDTSRLDTTAWVTILLLHYYRLLAIDHQTEWQAQYEISYRWLWSQFKGKESVEKEAFALISSFVTEYYVVDEQTHKDDVQFVSNLKRKEKRLGKAKHLSYLVVNPLLGNALEMRNRRANYFRDKQNKEALKGLGKSLELEPDNAKPSK
ncbi:159_t:CDS:2, partial [Paraglomus brasilianum]